MTFFSHFNCSSKFCQRAVIYLFQYVDYFSWLLLSWHEEPEVSKWQPQGKVYWKSHCDHFWKFPLGTRSSTLTESKVMETRGTYPHMVTENKARGIQLPSLVQQYRYPPFGIHGTILCSLNWDNAEFPWGSYFTLTDYYLWVDVTTSSSANCSITLLF